MVQGPLFHNTPVLSGHRGFGRGVNDGWTENTLPSFRAAVAHGLRWVEVDVRRTADDRLMVAHHPNTADGTFVSELTAAEAQSRGLLRLEELLEELPVEVGVHFDVKTSLADAGLSRSATTGAHVARVARREQQRRPVLVVSFDPSVLPIVRECSAEVPVGLLTWLYFPLRKAIPAAKHLGAQVVAAHTASFEPNRRDSGSAHCQAPVAVAAAHAAGLEVIAWCPTPQEMPALVQAGVDCLCVDDVPGALAAMAVSV